VFRRRNRAAEQGHRAAGWIEIVRRMKAHGGPGWGAVERRSWGVAQSDFGSSYTNYRRRVTQLTHLDPQKSPRFIQQLANVFDEIRLLRCLSAANWQLRECASRKGRNRDIGSPTRDVARSLLREFPYDEPSNRVRLLFFDGSREAQRRRVNEHGNRSGDEGRQRSREARGDGHDRACNER
jgi:hypothetical protein